MGGGAGCGGYSQAKRTDETDYHKIVSTFVIVPC